MKGVLSLSLLPLLTVASPVMPSTIHNNAAPILSSSNAVEVSNTLLILPAASSVTQDTSKRMSLRPFADTLM